MHAGLAIRADQPTVSGKTSAEQAPRHLSARRLGSAAGFGPRASFFGDYKMPPVIAAIGIAIVDARKARVAELEAGKVTAR